ncbi:MAG TPA: prephenate dehydratase domain-containing protein [Vicinamibacterales bacterium]
MTTGDANDRVHLEAEADDHRRFIDRIDKTIVALLCERMRLGERLVRPPGKTDTCAYQGVPGAFSEDAALALAGATASLAPCPTLADVFDALVAGHVRRAVVPIENTLAGRVPGCADLMARHGVRVVAERDQQITQALVAPPGVPLTAMRRVLSHPVAIAQCRRFLQAHPALSPVPVFDTAGAVAEIVRSGWTDAGAIASRRAAEVYGAVVLVDDIQDRPDNFTRFVLIEV